MVLGHHSIRELEETLDAEEWDRWLTFYQLYDLPDAYFLAAKYGAFLVGIDAHKACPIYEVPARSQGAGNVREFVAFAKGYLKSADRAIAKSLPQPKSRYPRAPLPGIPAESGNGA
jgi:hypothetical protein